ncbi:type II toxin-antitoxin system Phd/YefM family antitoxin [Tardiphaga alba]|uniref:Type II toxin-antitoxin system Phd/YefM family antitoxin n=1 Tax=Tardiphaga alba TaxID=340268 RepID=A0ABX8AHE8_9BRAD|nr:type II toxin-antitoxin system Phd/YefM family antitoxin [Tardiphaga alba]QUS42371.1 type II toxin-antitoxin system Phd/YefM family antitoxin [Tardiphaga alba]
MTTLTRNEFARAPDRATEAASDGPVFITDQGEPRHVLLSIDAYRRLKSGDLTLPEALAAPNLSDIDLDSELERPKTPPRIPEFD